MPSSDLGFSSEFECSLSVPCGSIRLGPIPLKGSLAHPYISRGQGAYKVGIFAIASLTTKGVL